MLLINFSLLVLGFIFSFFLPGFLIIESFFKDLPKIEKIPLYIILSLLVSTYLVYFLSLIFGFSRLTIVFSFLVFIPWLLAKKEIWKSFGWPREHRGILLFSVGVFLVYFISLYPAIFYKRDDNYVMSAVNWQDTAMHMSIIETISQGNFPPEAPYYSGTPLNYYYFSDFHTAILLKLWGNFFPRILVMDNPFFVFSFSLVVYALSFSISKSTKGALIAAFLAVFNGNMMFTHFLSDVSKIGLNKNFFSEVVNLLGNKGYTLEYGKLMQMVPMADYFLQNRPMMVGMGVFASLLMLLVSEKRSRKTYFLAGATTAMLLKFQLFAFLGGVVTLVVSFLVFLRRKAIGEQILRLFISFIVPAVGAFGLIISSKVNDRSMLEFFRQNFTFGPWQKEKSFIWFIKFYLTNFNVLPVILLFASIFYLFRKGNKDRRFIFLLATAFAFFLIPHLCGFTVFDYDMYKFFYLMIIPMAVLSGNFLVFILKRRVGVILVFLILVTSSFTSGLTLAWSFFNKYSGYSADDYLVGMWTRENTPKEAVFVSYPSVHSAVSEIGGRKRVLSYIVWPYSHGYNEGEDNVFARLSLVEAFFAQPTRDNLEKLVANYKVDYVFFGPEERNSYPQAEIYLERSNILEKVYETGTIKVYKVRAT